MITFKDLGNYGRLGNQLFQIASTIGIAISNKQEFGFPEWKYQNYFANKLPPLRPGLFRTYEELEPYYNDIRLSPDTDWNLRGYFQSWKYFDHCKGTIFHYLNFSRTKKDGVAVHIRRGDYLNLEHIHPVLPLTYYIKAINEFNNEHFTIFSDDIAWCKEHIQGYNISYYIGSGDDIVDFVEMSGYDKFIIANSSYSYWAAYLSKSDKVIAPNLYVKGETKDDRIPPWWYKI